MLVGTLFAPPSARIEEMMRHEVRLGTDDVPAGDREEVTLVSEK